MGGLNRKDDGERFGFGMFESFQFVELDVGQRVVGGELGGDVLTRLGGEKGEFVSDGATMDVEVTRGSSLGNTGDKKEAKRVVDPSFVLTEAGRSGRKGKGMTAS